MRIQVREQYSSEVLNGIYLGTLARFYRTPVFAALMKEETIHNAHVMQIGCQSPSVPPWKTDK